MRKKQLLELNHELYNSLEHVKASAEELRQENVKLKKIISELEKENEALKCRDAEAVTAINFVENEATEIETENVVILSNETEYAATIIGKIVVSATKYCSKLGAMSENPDAKELINLILGRTEVAKAEILKIISSDNAVERKNRLIDKEYFESEDYFQSVFAQNG